MSTTDIIAAYSRCNIECERLRTVLGEIRAIAVSVLEDGSERHYAAAFQRIIKKTAAVPARDKEDAS